MVDVDNNDQIMMSRRRKERWQ